MMFYQPHMHSPVFLFEQSKMEALDWNAVFHLLNWIRQKIQQVHSSSITSNVAVE